MSETGKKFVGQVPEYYNKGLVPIIFEDYAAEMARRVAELKPGKVLELASGTGVVTQAMADVLPPGIKIIASDLNDPMMDVARTRFSGDASVTFQVIDAMDLPFEDGALELVVCQFGVMFFPDKVASYKQALRVLRPGGQYLFSCWDSLEENECFRVAQKLCDDLYPDDPPAFYKVPFHYHDTREIEANLREAGFSNIDIEHKKIVKAVPSFAEFGKALVYGNPLLDEIVTRGGDPDEVVVKLIAALEAEFGKAPTEIPMSAFFVAARK